MNLSVNEMSEVVNIDISNMDTDNDNIEGYNEEVAIANPITKSAYIFDKESKLKTLTKLQFEVTQKDAIEKPFDNEYWDFEI